MNTSRSEVRRMLSDAVKSQASKCGWWGMQTIASQFMQAMGFSGGRLV